MQEYHVKIKAGGRIIIPAECRAALKIKEGDELVLHVENEVATLCSLKHALSVAQGLVKKHSKTPENLVKDLLKERRKEAKGE